MRRIFIKIAYDGTNYCGFQLQPDAPTIEGELNRALSLLTHEDIHIIGASRTDSGVHADGNAAVFDTKTSIPAERLPLAAAPLLPPDIRVTFGKDVGLDWHPRKTSCIKTYEYTISCGKVENPCTRLYSSFCKYRFDTERMREAAAYLIGEHDFTSFANPSSQVLMDGGSPIREIYSIKIEENIKIHSNSCHNRINDNQNICIDATDIDDNIGMNAYTNSSRDIGTGSRKYTETVGESDDAVVKITVTGNGFLYNMVRIIAGTLINVGSGLWKPERVREALKARDRTKAGPTAEARGLKLLDISYPESDKA